MKENNPIEQSGTPFIRWHKLIPLGFWIAMLIYVFGVTKITGGVIPLCLFHFITDLDCPGCGMTRASTAFLHGDIVKSLQYHPGGVLFVTWLTGVTFFQTSEFILNRDIQLPEWGWKAYHRGTRVALFFTFGYGVGRLFLELMGVIPALH